MTQLLWSPIYVVKAPVCCPCQLFFSFSLPAVLSVLQAGAACVLLNSVVAFLLPLAVV